MPRVSVIVPVLNRTMLLQDALESILAQSFRDWECLVVDDHSTDNTFEVMKQFAAQDKRFKCVRRSRLRQGACACRNEGFGLSQGEFVVFLDSDDLLRPTCLADRIEASRKFDDRDFWVFGGELFRDNPGDVGKLHNIPNYTLALDRFLSTDDPWHTILPLWSRAAIEKVGPWDESLPSWQDWDFNIRALVAGLRFEQFYANDCYIRIESADRSSIGLERFKPERLEANERTLDKVICLLQTNGILSAQRKRFLAQRHLLLCDRWASIRRSKEALRLWRVCYARGLISRMVLGEGMILLSLLQAPPLAQLARIFFSRWRKARNLHIVRTMGKVPVPVLTSNS